MDAPGKFELHEIGVEAAGEGERGGHARVLRLDVLFHVRLCIEEWYAPLALRSRG